MPRKPARKIFNFHLRRQPSSQENIEKNPPKQDSQTSPSEEPSQETLPVARPTRAAKVRCIQNVSKIISEERYYDLNVLKERARMRALQRMTPQSIVQCQQHPEDLRQHTSQCMATEINEREKKKTKHGANLSHPAYTMDEDVDIEEHDIMGNPALRNIFPDITVIKIEIEDYVQDAYTMEDNIDIEEHDVMDNPAIRHIFPDITVIKKEIEDYFQDDSHINDSKQEMNAPKPIQIIQEFQIPDGTIEDTSMNLQKK